MPYHARPLPAAAGTTTRHAIRLGTPTPTDPPDAITLARSTPPPDRAPPAPSPAPATAERLPELPTDHAARASTTATAARIAADASVAWYRREPWLAASLAAFAALGAGLLVPDQVRRYPIAAAAALMVLAVVLLVRQGLFRPALAPGSRHAERSPSRPVAR